MLSSDELQIIALSLQVAAVGTIFGLPLALWIAWLLAKSSIPGKPVLDTLVSFPLVLPPVVTGYALLLLIGRDGPVGRALNGLLGVDVVFTWVAASLAAGIVALPLMVRAIEVAMAGVDPRLELAARSLGAGPIRTFSSVTVPLARRGILAAALLGFARGLGEFGATIVVAGNIPGKTQTMPLFIYNKVQIGDDTAALRLIAASMVLALVALSVHQYLARRTPHLRS